MGSLPARAKARGEPGRVVSGTITIWLELGLIFVLEMRGVSSYEYVREKDKQGTGAKQRWAKLGPVGRYM